MRKSRHAEFDRGGGGAALCQQLIMPVILWMSRSSANPSAINPNAVPGLWKSHGLAGIDYAPYSAVTDGLTKLKVEVPRQLTAILVGQENFHEDAEAAKAHTAERLAHLVSTFRSSCVLSESVAVCTAFLEAMCNELADMRADLSTVQI